MKEHVEGLIWRSLNETIKCGQSSRSNWRKHSLEHHVVPQIRTFATGHYDKSHAELIHQQNLELNLERLINLTTYVPPVVIVVVNARSVLDDGWEILESDHSAQLTFLESFRSQDGDVIVSISGYVPTPPSRRIIKLRKHDMMNALVCTQPMDIPAEIVDKMRLYWGERPYIWRILRTKDSVIFLAPGGFAIRADRNYEVHRLSEGEYRLHQL